MFSLHSCPLCKPGSRYNGGMSIYIRELVHELAGQGHSIDIFTVTHAEEEHDGDLSIAPGVRLIHIECSLPAHLSSSYLNSWAELAASRIKESAGNYDLVHSHYWLSGLVAVILASHWEIPHITMFHTLGALKNKAGLGEIEPNSRISGELTVAGASDVIVASTDRETQELTNTYNVSGANVSLITCGVNLRSFQPIDREIARKLCGLRQVKTGLFVGRADPIKGLDRLLSIIDELNSYDFQLVIVGGESTINNRLLSFMKSSQSGCIPILVGSVSYEEMSMYYNAADFCIIPSYYESFSLVALESLACGTPVVSTDVGGIKKIVGNSDFCQVVPRHAENTLLVAILRMIQHEQLDSNSREHLRALVTDYGWDKISQQLLALYYRSIDKSLSRVVSAGCR